MEDLSEELDFLDLAIWLLMYEEHGNGYSRLYTEFEEGSFLGMGSVGGLVGRRILASVCAKGVSGSKRLLRWKITRAREAGERK